MSFSVIYITAKVRDFKEISASFFNHTYIIGIFDDSKQNYGLKVRGGKRP